MDNLEKLRAISEPSTINWAEIANAWEQEDSDHDKTIKLALAILSILRERKMTKKQLAEKMGVKPQFVSRIVRGGKNITLETINKIERALDVELVTIYDPTDIIESVASKNILGSDWTQLFNLHSTNLCTNTDVVTSTSKIKNVVPFIKAA